jgi:hypothetical protein
VLPNFANFFHCQCNGLWFSQRRCRDYLSNRQYPRSDDYTFTCRGPECAGSADSIGDAIREMLQRATQVYLEQEETKNNFCSSFASRQPSDCRDLFAPALFSGTNPFINFSGPSSWIIPAATNGCGTGSTFESIGATLVDLFDMGGFSGDVQEPSAGFEFKNSCDSHDLCYGGTSGSQTTCDNQFADSLRQSCNGNQNCQGFADIYTAAVRLQGEVSFSRARSDGNRRVQACRKYKQDHEANCSSSSGSGGLGSS